MPTGRQVYLSGNAKFLYEIMCQTGETRNLDCKRNVLPENITVEPVLTPRGFKGTTETVIGYTGTA